MPKKHSWKGSLAQVPLKKTKQTKKKSHISWSLASRSCSFIFYVTHCATAYSCNCRPCQSGISDSTAAQSINSNESVLSSSFEGSRLFLNHLFRKVSDAFTISSCTSGEARNNVNNLLGCFRTHYYSNTATSSKVAKCHCGASCGLNSI